MKTTFFAKRRNNLISALAVGIIATSSFAGTAFSASAATISASEYDMSQEPSYRRIILDDEVSAESTYSSGSNSSDDSGFDINYTMSDSDWKKVYYPATKADILVTKDFSTLGVDHGHAALMVDGINTVEHYGPANENVPGANGLSGKYLMSNLWKHTKTCRLYRYDGISSTKASDIATYAKENLIGWKYNAFAGRTTEDEMNCATLVWKAYKSADIELNGYWKGFPSYTMLPSDYVEQNPELTMIASVGWDCDAHKWK